MQMLNFFGYREVQRGQGRLKGFKSPQVRRREKSSNCAPVLGLQKMQHSQIREWWTKPYPGRSCLTRARLQHRCRSNRPTAFLTMSSVYFSS